MAMQDMDEYEEVIRKFLSNLTPKQRLEGLTPEQCLAGLAPEQILAGLTPEQILASLTPEQILAGLPPEQRLAGLDRDQQALALPVELLRVFPEEYIRSLSSAVQEEIRARIQRAARSPISS